MTTQKAQSKIKTSTIAITILSVLLAVAVAATIVLAAFATTKTATTTITFGGNLTLTLSSPASEGNFSAGALSGDTLTITQTNAGFTNAVTVPSISGETNMKANVAYKVTYTIKDRNGSEKTAQDAGMTITVTPASGFTESDGVYVSNEQNGFAANSSTAIIDSISVSATDYNAIAGYSVEIQIKFNANDFETAGNYDSVKTFA